MSKLIANLKFSDCFEVPNSKLRAYFGRVRAGTSAEYRTKFYPGQSPQDVCRSWDVTLSKIKDKWPTLYSFEEDLRKKVGPMSIMLPLSKRMKDIDSYYDSILLESKPIPDTAVESVIREWGLQRGVTIWDQPTTIAQSKLSTNSGSPYFASTRRSVIPSTFPVRMDGELMIQRGRKWVPCAVLGWRGQEGGPKPSDVKQRVVWMFPFGLNVLEGQAYMPLIAKAQDLGVIPAYIGNDAVDQSITKLFDTKRPNDLIVCTDFTKFDQHFNRDLQSCAHAILTQLLEDSDTSEEWLESVFPIKYSIPLAYDYGRIRQGDHGMASGSGGTNFDETLTHRALQYEAASIHGSKLNPYSQCLGDDGIISYPGITVEQVCDTYSKHGQEMNLDKQYASTSDCVYLRRWHHTDYRVDGICVGVYSTHRAIGRLCEQERFYKDGWGPKAVALRQLSILENVKYHPLREEFVNFCIRGDKYRLGLDIPGFLDNIVVEAQEHMARMPDFMSYSSTLGTDPTHQFGIADWWIVKYLKSLATAR